MTASRTERLAIAARYAEAVFALAVAAGKEDRVVAQLADFTRALTQHKEAAVVLHNPLMTRAAKAAFFSEILAKAEPLARDAAAMIARQGRAELLPEITQILSEKLAAHRGEVTAEVTSARALSTSEQKAITTALTATTGKNVQLALHQDEAAIGGMKIRLGSHLMDGTVATALNNLRRQLLAA
jgi:F-type H+-transporting ATPase subunit delta